MNPKSIISSYLIDTANSGSTVGVVDGSSTAVVFRYTCASLVDYIEQLTIFIEDGTNLAATYGGLTALTTGTSVDVKDSANAVLKNLSAGTIKRNTDFEAAGFDVTYSQHGSGNENIVAQLNFKEPLRLAEDQYICVTINDAMAGLVTQTFHVKGFSKA